MTTAAVAVVGAGSPGASAGLDLGRGVVWAGVTLGIWAAYMALSRSGVVGGGLLPVDFLPLRFAPAGLVFLPWLLTHGRWRDLGGVGWRRGAILAALVGPGFIMLGAGGYQFAPLAHGAVVQPGMLTLGTFALAWLVLGDRPGWGPMLGGAVMLAGMVLVAGPTHASLPGAWIGDAMFVATGLLWAVFTILVRRWGLQPLPVAAAVAVISAAVALPPYFAAYGVERLAALPAGALMWQFVVQGLGSGALAVVAFGKAVLLLGPARAALMPALVPGAAVLVGIPLTGEWPTGGQVAGLLLATLGLAVALRPGR